MNIKLILSILILLQYFGSYSQNYNETITKAYSYAYVNNDYQKAIIYFNKAFQIEKAKSTDLYYAADICLKMDSINKFKKYFSKAVACGYANYKHLEKQKKLKNAFNKNTWNALMQQAEKNYQVFEKDFKKVKKNISNIYKVKGKIIGKIDLRNDSLNIKHQGRRNTCSVFAATALLEYAIWEKYHKKEDLSEAYNYWASKKFALTNDYLKETYTHIDGLPGYIAVESFQYGVMDENNWKYENENWLSKKDERCIKINKNYCMECFTGTPPLNSQLTDYKVQPIFIEREDIGNYILQEHKPVAMNIFWYYHAIDNATGIFRLPTEKDIDKGGHVILLVGYNSKTKTFIFQNSWGIKWGNKGFGIIPEDYIINYYELTDGFPYANDASNYEKIEAIKGSMGVSVLLK